MKTCKFCEYELPSGCYGIFAKYPECSVRKTAPKSLEWKVGLALHDDLTDRRGIKHEIELCEVDVKAELIGALGKIAVEVVMKEMKARKALEGE